MTVIVDHATGRLVWAAEGRNTETLGRFFDQLGADRAALLTHVSCDGTEWIHAVIRARTPQAVICLDPFYADVRIMPMSGGLSLVTTVALPVRSA